MSIFFTSLFPAADEASSKAEILDTDVLFDADRKTVKRANGFAVPGEVIVKLFCTLEGLFRK